MSGSNALDPKKLDEFIGKFVQDLGAAMHGSTVVIGEKLGLYRGLNVPGGRSAAELAKETETSERFVLEWLSAQAASGYIHHDPKSGKFYLSPEQAFTLTNEKGPAYFPGAFLIASSNYRDEGRILDAFRTGKGVGWHERNENLFAGTNKFFRPNYVANLVSAWLPSLEGMVPRLQKGARVADVGCGFGSSTLLMAAEYPRSEFFGFDYHKGSIDAARSEAAMARAVERVHFEVASAQAYPGKEYDLVTFFDCLHDMSDPVGAAKHVHSTLKPDGVWMLVEPFAGEHLEENLNPVGRVFYSASAMICTPASLSEKGGAGLGAQASEHRLKEVATAGGFTRFRRSSQTPFNRVFEIRP
ncbi:MAG: methyltransferase domain-containing protein [Thermoplasmata archaeon]|nr:methyltransferase domain-containing protein [Thermoplasmata archaeon]